METEKIGFFKRVKLAIFNLEKYDIFAKERFSKALKYGLLLIVVVTLFLALVSTIKLSNEAEKFIDFFKSEEFPKFELKDGKLTAEKNLIAYDEEYNGSFIVDTNPEITDEQINNYKEQVKSNSISVICLNDKIIYNFGTLIEGQNSGLETTYNNITSLVGIKDTDKDKLVKDYLNNDMLFKIKSMLYIYSYITLFILNILTVFEDVLIIGLFGWIASKISRVALTISNVMSFAIYSLTLPTIISTIYSVVSAFTNFEIKYFQIMYMLISYIYIVAAIMIMKDGNKTASDVVTVEGQVIKTEDNVEEQEDEKKDKKKEKPKKENKDNEDLSEEKNIDNKDKREE